MVGDQIDLLNDLLPVLLISLAFQDLGVAPEIRDLSASDQGLDISPESKKLLERSRAPIESGQARLQRLANYRVQTRQRISSLQREHVQALLAAIVAAAESESVADDFEQLLQATWKAPAR